MTSRDDMTPHRDDELAVTEASAEVLAELSHLFGSQQPANNHGVTVVPSADDTPREQHTISDDLGIDIGDSLPLAEVVSLVPDDADSEVDSNDLLGDLTPAPADPLLQPMSRPHDIVEISDDSGGTVVIDDDDMNRVVIVDNDQPDPRFEERQRRHKRRERLKKVKWFKLAAVAVGVGIAIVGLLASPLFAIRQVTFEGNVYASQQTIDDVTALLEGASVFTADTQAAREIVLQDPWIAEVRITTHFPRSALIEVAERVPVVWYVGEDQKARVIDARGFIIASLEGWPTKYLQVTGTGPSLPAGTFADDVYRAAAQLVLALPDEIRGRVKSLELTGGGELSMTLKEGTIVRFGPPTDLQNKLVAVVVLFRRQDPSTLRVVDVSTGNPTVQAK